MCRPASPQLPTYSSMVAATWSRATVRSVSTSVSVADLRAVDGRR